MRFTRRRSTVAIATAMAMAFGAVALSQTGTTHAVRVHRPQHQRQAATAAQVAYALAANQADAAPAPQCTTGYQPQPGYDLDVCISANGTTVTPSINVTSAANTGGNCSIALEIWDDAGDRLDSTSPASRLPCKAGQATGVPLDLSALQVTTHTSPDGSLAVHAFARLYIDGQGIYIPGQGDSPAVTIQAGSAPGSTQSGKYNAAAAAAWARDNVFKIPDFYLTDDCADFVSQAMLLGGGLPLSGAASGNRTDDHNWYATSIGVPGGASYSWTSAAHLENYLKLSGRGEQVPLADAKPGDVIFVNWGPGGGNTPANNPTGEAGIDHVGMIVGNPGADGGYNVQIAQHTRDTIETLADWRNQNPQLQVWVFSVNLT